MIPEGGQRIETRLPDAALAADRQYSLVARRRGIPLLSATLVRLLRSVIVTQGHCVDKWSGGCRGGGVVVGEEPVLIIFKNEEGKKGHLPLTPPDKKKGKYTASAGLYDSSMMKKVKN